MILFISAQYDQLNGPIHERFGRCPWLIKFDTDQNKWEAFENPGATQSGGAGVASAQFAINHNTDAVISGDFGPNAVKALLSANIKMHRFSPDISTVQEAVEKYLRNEIFP